MDYFGKYLKAARLAAGMSQKKLALAIGVSDAYLSKLENESWRSASEDVIIKTADILGVDVDAAFAAAGKLHPTVESFMLEHLDVTHIVRLLSEGNYGIAIMNINETVGRLKQSP